MPSRANSAVASSARAWLLAACGFGLAVVLWDILASPHYLSPFGANFGGGPTVWTLTYVEPGRDAARAGLRVGDKVYWPQTADYRVFIVGRPLPIRAQRGTRVFEVSIVPVAVPFDLREWLDNLNNLWAACFATIVAWFGVGRRARLLSWLFLFWALSGTGLQDFVSPLPWLNEAVLLLLAPVNAMPVVLLVTLSSTFGRPVGPLREALAWIAYAVAAISFGFGLLTELTFITPWFNRVWPLIYYNGQYQIAPVIASLFGAASAFAALATVRSEERQRAAWLLFPLAAIFVVWAIWTVASIFAGGYYGGAQQTLAVVGNFQILILYGIMSYAVLSRRLLDVEFAINRAAVFALVSFIVIGIFVAFEWLFNVLFDRATHTESTIASLGIALALGVSLSYIHHYVDKFVDRVMFRKRHEREKALRDFAHEASFITDREMLLDDTVRDVQENAETDDIAILLLDRNGSYATARTTNGVLSSVGPNDRAILKLRAWHKPIDLHDVETNLSGTRVYPLMSRGELLGVLVCGHKRDHQGFAPDEDDALFTMARGVGSALGTLREPGRDGAADLILELRDMMRDQREMMRDLHQKWAVSSTSRTETESR